MLESAVAWSAERSREIFNSYVEANILSTNRMFAILLSFQWIAGIVAALLFSPLTWHGASFSIHPNVWMAIVVGGLAMNIPLCMIAILPKHVLTRHVIAISQMIFSALFIDISGGRIETHFHIFGSLAFLAFYRDWRVLITASIVVVLDHLLVGMWAPQAVYGVLTASPLRTVEHAVWVVFTDCFLIYSCLRSRKEMEERAEQRALLESTNRIIEQKVEEQLQELGKNEKHTQMILDTAGDAIFSLSETGTIVSANLAASRILGHTAAKLGRMKFTDFVRLCDKQGNSESFLQYAERCTQDGASGREEQVATKGDGTTIPVEVSIGMIVLGTQRLYTCILQDISERKQAERRVNEFYSTISHELRSPLTSIRGALALIEGGKFGALPSAALELVTLANGSTKRLIRLINDILDLRKIEAGKMDLNISKFDVSEVLTQSVDGMRGAADKAGVSFQVSCRTEEQLVGDQDRIVQVLTNLLSNAVKFAPAGDRIEITAEPCEGQGTRISVTDHGSGIAESDFPKLFQKFQQVDSSDSRTGEGTGLGLAICKALIEQQEGKIGFSSRLDEGSTFWFEVPGAEPATKALPLVSVVLSDAQKTLLIVEDDDELSAVLGAFLRSEGYNCLHAPTIADAERILATVLPNAMIMDLGLPDGDGLQLIDKMQETRETSGVPVVVLTGSDRKRENCHRMVIDWLRKPALDEELLLALSRALEQGSSPTVLIVDDDPEMRSIISKQISTLGAICLEASDGAEAISMVRKHKPQLMILDVMMPRPNGYEVVDILRANSDRNLRLIVHSACDLSESDRKRLSLGLTRCINKASRNEYELLDAVKQLLDGCDAATTAAPEEEAAATAV